MSMRADFIRLRYCRIEKIPGGTIEDCKVIKGVVLNKDVTHAKMRRRLVVFSNCFVYLQVTIE